MNKVYMVITDCGDGSNATEWTMDPAVIDRMEELVDEGSETYSSGDGLQVIDFTFPDGFDIPAWLNLNYCSITTLEDLDD